MAPENAGMGQGGGEERGKVGEGRVHLGGESAAKGDDHPSLVPLL